MKIKIKPTNSKSEQVPIHFVEPGRLIRLELCLLNMGKHTLPLYAQLLTGLTRSDLSNPLRQEEEGDGGAGGRAPAIKVLQ